MGDVLIRNYSESNYILYFDRESGMFVRISMSGQEPFWNVNGPELVDISITNYCEKGCGFCYRASNPSGSGSNYSLGEISNIAGVFDD